MSLADCTPALCSNTRVEGAAVLVACRCPTTLGRFCARLGTWLASRAFLTGHLIKHEVRWRKILRHQTSPLHEVVMRANWGSQIWTSCPSSLRTFSMGTRVIVPPLRTVMPKVICASYFWLLKLLYR